MRTGLVIGLLVWLLPAKGQWAGTCTMTLDGDNAESCYVTVGNWSIAWDNSYLYIVKKFGSTTEPAILYFDVDPQYPVTWGTNANGSLTGVSHWDIQPNLPFRADLCVYWEYNSAEYRTDDGSGSWNSTQSFNSVDYAYNSTFNSDREIRISWTSVFGLSGRPSAFNFMAYANTRGTLSCNGSTNVGCIYDQTPSENPTGNCSGSPACFRTPNCEYYWRCNNTSSSGTHNPFLYRSYTYLGSGGTLGQLGITPDIYDFTLNRSAITINKSGKWHFKGRMCVSDGTIEFDTNGDSLIVDDSLTVMGTGHMNMESSTGQVWVKRDLTNRATGSGFDLTLSDNSSSKLIIGGNFRNFADFKSDSTTVEMHDHRVVQTMQMIRGDFSGTSSINKLSIDNDNGVRISPDDSLVVIDTLNLIDGKLDVDSAKYLRLRNGCEVINSGGPDDGRFIEGWLSREIHGTDNVIFHVGDGNRMARVAIEPASAQTGRTYTLRYIPSGHQYNSNFSAGRVGSSGLDHASYVEYWEIHCNQSNDDAELTLYWTSNSVVSSTSSDWQNLRVSRWVGGSTNEWMIDGSTPNVSGSSTSDGFIDAESNTTTFDDVVFTIGSTTSPNPLPVELLHFDAQWLTEKIALVQWQTATEINNRGFELYHSYNGREWSFTDWFEGQGNSHQIRDYAGEYALSQGVLHYFRLKQIDEDGKFSWYGPVVLEAMGVKKASRLYPNPFQDKLQLEVPEVPAELKLFNSSGQNIFNTTITTHYTLLPLIDLPNGLYVIQLTGREKTERFKLSKH